MSNVSFVPGSALRVEQRYCLDCCNFHATGGHSADRHGLDSASVVYNTTDIDAYLKANGDPDVLNENARSA